MCTILKTVLRLSRLLILVWTVGGISSCTVRLGGTPSPEIVKKLPGSTVLLRFEGGAVHAADVESLVDPQLEGLRDLAIGAYRSAAMRALRAQLLDGYAQSKGFKNELDWKKSEQAKIQFTDEALRRFMAENHLPEVAKAKALGFLTEQRLKEVEEAALAPLLESAHPQWLLDSASHFLPPGPESRSRGALHGATSVVHGFCDFTDPACATYRINMEFALARAPKQLRYFFHPLPDETKDSAQLAAKASLCAAENGKFWKFHDQLFNQQANISAALIHQIATQVGMDSGQFEKCLGLSATQAALQTERALGQQVGALHSPSYFVNGERVGSPEELSQALQKLSHSEAK